MEKISGIIKNSPRVPAVDLRDAMPVRPGTPSFGRPEGVSTLAKPVVSEPSLDETHWKSKDQKHAAIAADLTNKFLLRPSVLEESAIPKTAVPVDSIQMSFAKPEAFPERLPENFNEIPDTMPMMAQPDGYFPRGSFINRLA